jgi:predicted amidohydrolase YtcJ
VSTPDPLQAMQVAVTRVEPGTDAEPFLPEQTLPLEVAFAAYTSGSAWACHRDLGDGAGVLAPGAVADLVVLDRDPFAGHPGEVGSARVLSTWIDGTAVYEA